MTKIVTKRIVEAAIDSASDGYEHCWDILVAIEQPAGGLPNFLSFQPTLAKAIYSLGDLYHALSHERECFIGRKESINYEWFSHRLDLIGRYQEAIKDAIVIGKTLGDFFAWRFFYQDRDQLIEQGNVARVVIPPSGIGGKGELTLAVGAQVLEGHFLLHHGITNLLRLGDVSVFDLKRKRLAAVIEIKTHSQDRGVLNINMSMISDEKEKLDRITAAIRRVVQPPTDSENATPELDQHVATRLRRQRNQIGKSLTSFKPDANISLEDESRFERFASAFDLTPSRRVTFHRISEYHFVAHINLFSESLSKRLFGELNSKELEELQELVPLIQESVVEGSEFNHLFYSMFHNPTADAVIDQGSIPIFYWRLDTEIVRRLVFHQTLVLTVYNPASLLERLRDKGFEIIFSENRYRVTKEIGGNTIQLSGLPFFFRLIARDLSTEEGVLEIIDEMISPVEKGKVGPNTAISLRYFQMPGRKPA